MSITYIALLAIYNKHNIVEAKYRNSEILKSYFSISVIVLATKLLGYLEKIILAYYYGTSEQVDIYNVVFASVFSIFIFFREIIEPGFLNVFLKLYNDESTLSAWGLFFGIGKYMLVVLLIITVIICAMPQLAIDFLAPGFDNETRLITAAVLRISFPAAVFMSLTALSNIALNGLKVFIKPAIAEFVFKLIVVLSIGLLIPAIGIYSVAAGVLAGSMAKMLIHITALMQKGVLYQPSPDAVYILRVWSLTWPIMIGVVFSQAAQIIDNAFASYFAEGTISAVNYAKKLVELPVLLFPYALSVILFPYLSDMAIKNQIDRLTHYLSQSLGWITIVFCFLSIFYFINANTIVEVAFKRGAFGDNATVLTALPTKIYAVGLLFFALESIIVIFYFASHDTKTPIIVGICCVIANILITYTLMKAAGYIAIALGVVISKLIKTMLLLYLLKDKIYINIGHTFRFVSKVIAAVVVTAVALYFTSGIANDNLPQIFLWKLFYLIVSFLIGGTVYALSLQLVNINKNKIL